MPSRSVPRKYAEALFQLAEKAEGPRAILGDLESLVGLLRRMPTLLSFLESPDVGHEEKLKLLQNSLREKVKQSTWLFLTLLLRRKRIELLPEILAEFVAIDEEKRGVQRARVVSAVSLEKGEEKLLTSALRRITGKEILVETRVDPAIMGGVVVYLNGKVIDGSARNRLEELRNQLLATPAN
ncbi:MAG: ATP synthase F1 subunit delta [Candidatus Eiseniibacteriota bacterium]|nr:MAG: ATP synthase F1 subunit delta [Candidatus Eisenbacteria bacterium]